MVTTTGPNHLQCAYCGGSEIDASAVRICEWVTGNITDYGDIGFRLLYESPADRNLFLLSNTPEGRFKLLQESKMKRQLENEVQNLNSKK